MLGKNELTIPILPNCIKCPALRYCIKNSIFSSTDPNSSCVQTRIEYSKKQQPKP